MTNGVRIRPSLASALALYSLFAAVAVAASAQRVTSEQLSALITVTRSQTTVERQVNTAQKVAYLVKDANLEGVDDATLRDLAALLDTSNDGVRLWAAAALGYFGNRATFAVPKLLQILPEVDCQVLRGLNSAGAIRLALERIGATPPPRNCGARPKISEGA